MRDIIEKLKAKKNEKEDFVCLVKETTEEQLINERENTKKKILLKKAKLRYNERRMEERRIARGKRSKMEEDKKIRKK